MDVPVTVPKLQHMLAVSELLKRANQCAMSWNRFAEEIEIDSLNGCGGHGSCRTTDV